MRSIWFSILAFSKKIIYIFIVNLTMYDSSLFFTVLKLTILTCFKNFINFQSFLSLKDIRLFRINLFKAKTDEFLRYRKKYLLVGKF